MKHFEARKGEREKKIDIKREEKLKKARRKKEEWQKERKKGEREREKEKVTHRPQRQYKKESTKRKKNPVVTNFNSGFKPRLQTFLKHFCITICSSQNA